MSFPGFLFFTLPGMREGREEERPWEWGCFSEIFVSTYFIIFWWGQIKDSPLLLTAKSMALPRWEGRLLARSLCFKCMRWSGEARLRTRWKKTAVEFFQFAAFETCSTDGCAQFANWYHFAAKLLLWNWSCNCEQFEFSWVRCSILHFLWMFSL